jgi:hypothetical protein
MFLLFLIEKYSTEIPDTDREEDINDEPEKEGSIQVDMDKIYGEIGE